MAEILSRPQLRFEIWKWCLGHGYSLDNPEPLKQHLDMIEEIVWPREGGQPAEDGTGVHGPETAGPPMPVEGDAPPGNPAEDARKASKKGSG